MLVVIMVLTLTSSVMAGWFDYSEEEYLACNQKYFGKPEGTFEDFMALDLTNIENADDAKMLYKSFAPMIEPYETEFKALQEKAEYLKPEVKRYFGVLYTKEIHDELWESTRPLKQAAFQKALTEYNEAFNGSRTVGTTFYNAKAVAEILNRISKDFKEVEAQ